MTRSVFTKVFMYYIALGFVCFFLIVSGGSYLVELRLEEHTVQELLKEVAHIAEHESFDQVVSSENMEELKRPLKEIADFQNASIWITAADGEILFDTANREELPEPSEVLDTASRLSQEGAYEIGSFHDCFSAKHLTVVSSIIRSTGIKGYVFLHYPMQQIYNDRSTFQEVLVFMFLLLYGAAMLLILLYRSRIHKPLQQIVNGASEFGNGNLSYKIPIKTDDEMGYLANSLNYMADKLNRNGEYQRRFISNVSHDFRSPLTSIKVYVQAMLDGTIPPELQEKYLKIIAYESERLEKLTRSLLALNDLDIKKRLMHVHRFDINETLRTTAATFEGSCAKRNIQLVLYLTGKELFVRADMEQIQQVIYNLLDNALKFSNNNSSIILETTEKNGKVFVSVKDHGSGIPKEKISKIWERFYKLDTSRGKDRLGTGLGLSIVKEIINAHGQNINVISTEGVGTEFIFTLEKAK